MFKHYGQHLLALGCVIFGLVLLELCLQAVSLVHTGIRNHRNALRPTTKQHLTVVCLGESTTQYQYPKYLEEELKTVLPDKLINVIDEGQAGANTDLLMGKLPRIEKYKPDIVVAMMGCQDLNPHFVRYGNIQNPLDYWLVKHIKLYALIRYLYYEWMHNTAGQQHILPPKQPTDFTFKLHPQYHTKIKHLVHQYSNKEHEQNLTIKAHIQKHRNHLIDQNWDPFFFDDDFIFRATGKSGTAFTMSLTEELTQKVFPHERAKLENLAAFCRKQMQNNDKTTANAFAFLLITLYCDMAEYDKIFDVVAFLQKTYPNSIYLKYRNSVHHNIVTKEFSQAWLQYTDELIKNPENHLPYCYACYDKIVLQVLTNVPKHILTEKYEQLVTMFPADSSFYASLTWLYSQSGNTDKLAALYNFWLDNMNDIVKQKPEDFNFWTKTLQMLQKHPTKQYPAYESEMLFKNYIKLAKFCRDNNILLVCMQYPTLDMEPLKKLLKNFNVVFVSNEQPFKDLIVENGFNTYFKDNFGGCFGHATDEGNRLIAKNVAAAVAKAMQKSTGN